MYGCESWTVKKAGCRRIDAFELWCWRRLLRVPWTARRSNQSILIPRSPTPPRPVRLGDPSLLRAQCSLGVSNDGWEFRGSAGRKQLSEGRPVPQGGSCTPASSGERKSLGNKEKTLSPANEGRSRCSRCLQYLAFLLFLTLLLSTVGVLRGETSLEWKKPGVFSVRAHRPPGPRLVKSLSAQESRRECILVACVLCY